MTTALPAPVPATAIRRSPAPRLQLVGERPPAVPAHGIARGRVGYLVFLPADVDPMAVMTAHGIRPEIHPLEPGTFPAPEQEPAPRPDAVRLDDRVQLDDRVRLDDAVRVDGARRLAEVDGRELDLTYLEFDLLAHLVAHPYTVHRREALISDIWGYGHIGDGRTVDVHVARLRRKLGPAHRGRITTVRRVGYKYVPDHQ
ncbi:winged helix-turn-helix domain-containing protein [Streptomyces sp. NPDC048357]|uniref:winged helix-turn-helix domain-containing protein n=1 Tax=Streptomyces sp. NPDC048357 TaxID=3154719 RepID=UPI00342D742B